MSNLSSLNRARKLANEHWIVQNNSAVNLVRTLFLDCSEDVRSNVHAVRFCSGVIVHSRAIDGVKSCIKLTDSGTDCMNAKSGHCSINQLLHESRIESGGWRTMTTAVHVRL